MNEGEIAPQEQRTLLEILWKRLHTALETSQALVSRGSTALLAARVCGSWGGFHLKSFAGRFSHGLSAHGFAARGHGQQ